MSHNMSEGEEYRTIGPQVDKTMTDSILSNLLTLAHHADAKQVLAKYNSGMDSCTPFTLILWSAQPQPKKSGTVYE